MRKLAGLAVICALFPFYTAVAQTQVTFSCSLPATKKMANYKVTSWNYAITRQPEDTVLHTAAVQDVTMSVGLKGPLDPLLLQWLANPAQKMDGSITCKDLESGKVSRTFTFTGASVGYFTESLNAGSYGEAVDGYINIMFSSPVFTIDGVAVKLQKNK